MSKQPPPSNKLKFYLSVAIFMVIVIIVWTLALSHSLSRQQRSQPNQKSSALSALTQEVNNLFVETNKLKNALFASPTTSSDTLQPAAELTPAELMDLLERIDLHAASSTPTSTTTPELIDTADWLTYTNEEYGFEFKYPKNTIQIRGYINGENIFKNNETGNQYSDSLYFYIKSSSDMNPHEINTLKNISDKKTAIYLFNDSITGCVLQLYASMKINSNHFVLINDVSILEETSKQCYAIETKLRKEENINTEEISIDVNPDLISGALLNKYNRLKTITKSLKIK